MQQINLNFQIPNWFKWLGWIVAIVLLLLMKNCKPETQIATVTIPEVKGKFENKKPTHVEITPKNIHSKEYVYKKGGKVYIENPLNKELAYENEILMDQFKIADSINKVLLYKKCNEINKFSSKFDDENLELTIEGIVRGEVQEITPSYTIKPKKIEVPLKVKKEVFSLKAGAEIGSSNLQNFTYKGNVFINDFSVSIDNNKNYYIGYSVPIFSFKK